MAPRDLAGILGRDRPAGSFHAESIRITKDHRALTV